MNSLAELILSLCDLVEAEGRLLKTNILRLFRSCVIGLIGLLFGAAALAFFVGAIYNILVEFMPQYAALAIVGLVCIVICAVLVWSAGKCDRNKKTKKTSTPKNN